MGQKQSVVKTKYNALENIERIGQKQSVVKTNTAIDQFNALDLRTVESSELAKIRLNTTEVYSVLDNILAVERVDLVDAIRPCLTKAITPNYKFGCLLFEKHYSLSQDWYQLAFKRTFEENNVQLAKRIFPYIYGYSLNDNERLWLGPPYSDQVLETITYEEWLKCSNLSSDLSIVVMNLDSRIYQDLCPNPTCKEHLVLAIEAGSIGNIRYLEFLDTSENNFITVCQSWNDESIKYFVNKYDNETVLRYLKMVSKPTITALYHIARIHPSPDLADYLPRLYNFSDMCVCNNPDLECPVIKRRFKYLARFINQM